MSNFLTLYRLLKKKKILPEKEAIKFLVDVLNGFTQLIKNGIIHRDLKPANIILDKTVILRFITFRHIN